MANKEIEEMIIKKEDKEEEDLLTKNNLNQSCKIFRAHNCTRVTTKI